LNQSAVLPCEAEFLDEIQTKTHATSYSFYNSVSTEPVFLKVYGAQESIPRNESRQHM
jgi:hypothetical protein